MKEQRTSPVYLAPKDLAHHFGVHLNTVYKWIRDGLQGVPATPRRKRYKAEEVAEWLTSRYGNDTTAEHGRAANE